MTCGDVSWKYEQQQEQKSKQTKAYIPVFIHNLGNKVWNSHYDKQKPLTGKSFW